MIKGDRLLGFKTFRIGNVSRKDVIGWVSMPSTGGPEYLNINVFPIGMIPT